VKKQLTKTGGRWANVMTGGMAGFYIPGKIENVLGTKSPGLGGNGSKKAYMKLG